MGQVTCRASKTFAVHYPGYPILYLPSPRDSWRQESQRPTSLSYISGLKTLMHILPGERDVLYKTGWFSEALLDNLRLRVAVRFVSVFPEPGFEDVFKSIQDEFERSEKTRAQKVTLKSCQPDHLEITKEETCVLSSASMEPLKGVKHGAVVMRVNGTRAWR
ncbi:hypothetical protein Bca4012_059450 [Brassica carinata]